MFTQLSLPLGQLPSLVKESVAIDDGDFTRMVSKVEWTPQLPPLTASYGAGQVLQAMIDNCSKPSPEG
uniref:START domain-containing protein n=1 Tax=Angiostrongylus cantonensis TaxID=6313 RepID=A0A0K0DRS6_ANGCA